MEQIHKFLLSAGSVILLFISTFFLFLAWIDHQRKKKVKINFIILGILGTIITIFLYAISNYSLLAHQPLIILLHLVLYGVVVLCAYVYASVFKSKDKQSKIQTLLPLIGFLLTIAFYFGTLEQFDERTPATTQALRVLQIDDNVQDLNIPNV